MLYELKQAKLKLEATTFIFLNNDSLIYDFGEYTKLSFNQHILVINNNELETMGRIKTPLTHNDRRQEAHRFR